MTYPVEVRIRLAPRTSHQGVIQNEAKKQVLLSAVKHLEETFSNTGGPMHVATKSLREKVEKAIKSGTDIKFNLNSDLEYAVLVDGLGIKEQELAERGDKSPAVRAMAWIQIDVKESFERHRITDHMPVGKEK